MTTPPTPQPHSTAAEPDGTSHTRAYAFAFVPLGFLVLIGVIAPRFFEPLSDDRASVAGFPVSYALIAFVLILTLINVLIVRFVRNPVVVGIALAITIMWGLLVVFLAPAFVLIAVNLEP